MIIQRQKRVKFDLYNNQHVQLYQQFLIHKKWGTTGCPFELEHPWTSIPDMIKDKLIQHHLKV